MARDVTAKPDSRRLHGFSTPGGIVFRDLQHPHRPWVESRAVEMLRFERETAAASLRADGLE